MKIWYPKICKELKDRQVYITSCQSDLNDFKRILRANINRDKVKAIQAVLTNSTLMKLNKDFSVVGSLESFINSLICRYDPASSRCYYTVSELIRCKGTDKSLNFMIKLFEFGNSVVPSLNWIRHSYAKFKAFVTERDEQHGGKQEKD